MRALFSPPNLLTCVRIVLTPIIVLAIITNKCTQAFWLSLIAGFTDAADGYVARWMGEVTRIGAYLDPIADKVLMTALYVCFGIAGLAPGWLVWLVVGRDVMILSLAGGGLFWKGIRDFPPTVWGKLCTLLQIAASLGIIAGCAFGIDPVWSDSLIYATACVTAWSGIHYLGRALASMSSVSR
jgi:cardiolipin synthase